MSYNIEDLKHDLALEHLSSLTLAERLQGLSVTERLQGLSLGEISKYFPPEEIEIDTSNNKQASETITPKGEKVELSSPLTNRDILVNQILVMHQREGMDLPYDLEEFKHSAALEYLPLLTIEERLEGLSARELLQGLSAEEVLQGLSAQTLLQGVSTEQLAACIELLKAKTPSADKT